MDSSLRLPEIRSPLNIPNRSPLTAVSFSPEKDVTGHKLSLFIPKVKVSKTLKIAKKIADEEVYGSNLNLQLTKSNIKLLQINEDKNDIFEGISELDDGQSDLDSPERQKLGSSNNLFQTNTFQSPKYKEQPKGPVMKNGQIVRHSILGSVEGYERYQRVTKKILNTHVKGSNMSSEPTTLTDTSISRQQTKDLSDVTPRGGSASSSQVSKHLSIRYRSQKDQKKEVAVTKDELMTKIDEIKKIQERLAKEERQEARKLPFTERLYQTKEERCLQRFEDMTGNWNKDIFYITKKIGKEPQSSVMSRSGWFREKKELGEMIEATKTEAERIGDNYWAVTLRKGGQDMKKINTSNLLGKNGNSSLRPINTDRSFQVIRKPNTYLNETFEGTSASRMASKLIDRTSKEYLEKKFGQFGKIIKKINPCNGNDVGELMVRI